MVTLPLLLMCSSSDRAVPDFVTKSGSHSMAPQVGMSGVSSELLKSGGWNRTYGESLPFGKHRQRTGEACKSRRPRPLPSNPVCAVHILIVDQINHFYHSQTKGRLCLAFVESVNSSKTFLDQKVKLFRKKKKKRRRKAGRRYKEISFYSAMQLMTPPFQP